ncbi:PhzF family phenazine biosynthesis protein [Nocardiopsis chromatogenes]|uniref:PhzF family phenazine biosynthesis protein n=1 Tax=Nocardiopsis chromatogenes TaxID=280239 RepID=UPI0003456663|nr:PhzF family phenazine biosynthesis isomerase [Nocardiopsis chromatogenes]
MTAADAPGAALRAAPGTHRYVVADAFADTPLLGNPVAVFFGADDIPAETMQRIAREMNLSEVVFLLRPTPGAPDADVRVRIFTPVNELPFAGHPLLGTAGVLADAGARERVRMQTAMGTVPFDLEPGPGSVRVRMLQPVPEWAPYEHAAAVLAALGLEDSVLPVEVYRNGPRHVFVGLQDYAALSAVRPDLRALEPLPDMAVNCFAGPGPGTGTVWRSRMFSPAYGVAEDAATGSAAGPLALHLARYGLAPYGTWIDIHQGVDMGRPSHMRARVTRDGGAVSRVEVGGDAVIVARGTLLV